MPAGRIGRQEPNEGVRPSATVLMALVDQDDPAFLSIANVLHEMQRAGIAFGEQVVNAAVAVGRMRHSVIVEREGHSQSAEASELFDAESIVYYIRRAELVKIGTTCRPHRRFSELLPDEIVAWEPGARPEERARHQEFAALRLGGSEYFKAHDHLEQHMSGLRQIHGAPDPDWPTLATVTAIRPRQGDNLPSPENPTLVTLGEGAETLGVKRNTADMWVHRKALLPAGTNALGRPLYLLAHMQELARRGGLLP